MKLVYSELKKFLPDLDKSTQEIAGDLTLIGHMSERVETISGEQVIDLEIRQNRGDCLGYYGLAKEISVLYNLELKTTEIDLPETETKKKPPIKISAEDKVQRIMSLEITNLENKSSPDWLKKFLAIHDINSINTLVDLTNYIMLIYGIPCHAFDSQKVNGDLIWKITNKKDQIITLDGTKIDIPKNSFVISDDQGAVSLPVLGGKRTAIDLNTNQTIIEMAVYDPQKVRLDAKKMNVQTDAKVRLEKDLDPKLIPSAFKHLIQLVVDECGGEVATKTLDFYPKKSLPPEIELNLEKTGQIAGVEISDKFSLKTLKRLGCKLDNHSQNKYLVKPPSLRKDLNLEEDLIEEIIRFYGYDKISTDEPIGLKKLPDITPNVIYLKQTMKNILVNMGYDEIRSWPIINKKNLYQSKSLPSDIQPVETENSVNENYPLLRMSLASSLFLQNKQCKKYKLPDRKFFEIGKIYYKQNNKYHEHYSVAFYQPNEKKLIKDAENILKKLGKPGNYQVEEIKNIKIIEVNLSQLADKIKNVPNVKLKKAKKQTQQAIELTKQIIDLDANIILDEKKNPKKLIKKYQQKIDRRFLWKLTIVDIFKNQKGKYKYTFRAFYYNVSSKKAKQIHLEAFNLK